MASFLQRVTHGMKQGRFEMSPRAALSLLGVFIVLAIVATCYLILVSRTAAKGRYIEKLQEELFALQRENEHLEVEIANASAVSRMIERARELGFIPAEQVIYLQPATGGE